jgi:hypothetical protein
MMRAIRLIVKLDTGRCRTCSSWRRFFNASKKTVSVKARRRRMAISKPVRSTGFLFFPRDFLIPNEGNRSPAWTEIAGTIADDCMDAGGTTPWRGEVDRVGSKRWRAMQEQLPTTAWMQEVEQCRSNCRVRTFWSSIGTHSVPMLHIKMPGGSALPPPGFVRDRTVLHPKGRLTRPESDESKSGLSRLSMPKFSQEMPSGL